MNQLTDIHTTAILAPKMKPSSETYEPPRIVHKGQLKQFAGSPLSPEPNGPADILGIGG